MRNLISVFLFSLISINVSQATSLLPENNVRIPVNSVMANDMTYEEFRAVIKSVYDVYSPVIHQRLGFLNIQGMWTVDIVNAYAQRLGPLYNVNIYGGLARHHLVTKDGLLLALCHEIGHHLGGAPKTRGIIFKWPTSEGGADYFSTFKCFRRVTQNDDNIAKIKELQIDDGLSEMCAKVYPKKNDQALCIRSAMAGKSLANLFAEVVDDGMAISFLTPSQTVVDTNLDTHTDSQCRLDTYLQGALCNKDLNDPTLEWKTRDDACSLKKGDVFGTRPRCWFASLRR
jgi:hypothetical protein